MAKQEKSKGFVIKLSCETVQKLVEEEQQAQNKKGNELPGAAIEVKPIPEVTKKITDDKSTQNISFVSKDQAIVGSVDITAEECSSVHQQATDSNENPSTKNVEKHDAAVSVAENNAWGDYTPYITYEGQEAIYTDPSTRQQYTWSKDTNSWAARAGQDVPGRVYSFENDTHIYTEADGSKFFWDEEKKAWIPKVDDDFLAYYQMSYGFVDNAPKAEEKKDEDKKETQKCEGSGVKRKNEPQWFEPSDETNTKVYVSNLPQDLTEEEFVTFMQKCGLVERDASTQKMKVKLYMDKEHDCFKGDALCTYIKVESVDLALKLLDGSDFKGNKIKVERAHFQLKGEYNPALKPKKKKKKELEKIKKMQQKLFDWRPEKFIGERAKHEKVVIIKNLFHPSDFDKDVQLILDYQQDLREECSKCGEVRKVVIYDRHPEGVAQVSMKEPEQADAVVQLINGRWFGKRQITAEIWDGRTKYRIAETDADISKRIDKWDKFLEQKEEDKTTENIKKVEVESNDKQPPTVSKDLVTEGQKEKNVHIVSTETSSV